MLRLYVFLSLMVQKNKFRNTSFSIEISFVSIFLVYKSIILIFNYNIICMKSIRMALFSSINHTLYKVINFIS